MDIKKEVGGKKGRGAVFRAAVLCWGCKFCVVSVEFTKSTLSEREREGESPKVY